MTISLNGQGHRIDSGGGYPLRCLLDDLGFAGRPVLVEHNGRALRQRDWDGAVVREGDRIELMQVVAGG